MAYLPPLRLRRRLASAPRTMIASPAWFAKATDKTYSRRGSGPVHLRLLNLQTQQPDAAPCQSSRQPSLEGGRVNLDLAEGIEEPDSAETTATDPLNLVPR